MAWLYSQADKEATKDVIGFGERVSQLVAIAGLVLVMLFIVIHQTRPTGFFTEGHASTAASVLYVSLAFGVIPPLAKFLLGRKNSVRPIEALANIPFVLSSIYLLAVFPFDFSHFADPLPRSLEFLLDWVPASLAKLVLVVGVFGGLFAIVLNLMLYGPVKERLAKSGTASDKPMNETTGPGQ